MNKTWAEVSCEVPAAMVDLVSDYLVELSGNGVSIDNLNLDTFSLDSVEDSPIKTVRAYFTPGAGLNGTIAELERLLREQGPNFSDTPLPSPTVTLIKEEDWANDWKQHFSATRLGKRLVVKPTWEPFAPAENDLVIELDPGMAFGTGTHSTTKLCMEALDMIFAGEDPYASALHLPPREILDVGTGSGILAIAAAKLGACHVCGTDIDPEAIQVASSNIELNGVAQTVQLSTTPLEELTGTFDVVLANILAEELVRLRRALSEKVRPGGFLVLSGILNEKEEFVINGFSDTGLVLAATSRDGEWSCLTYRAEQ